MRPNKPSKLDKRHPDASRDAMEDIKDLTGEPKAVRNDVRYVGANRDRALGEADRTGRHYDGNPPETPEEGSEGSDEHEGD
jgi:hypothetical protein